VRPATYVHTPRFQPTYTPQFAHTLPPLRWRQEGLTMAVDERARHELYQQLERVVGKEATDTLMSYLPPVGWADVVTKHDLRGEMAALRGEMAELRGEMAELRGEMRGEIGNLRAEIHAVTRTLVLSVIGAQVGIAGMALALARIGG
jgi:hypothetical protein